MTPPPSPVQVPRWWPAVWLLLALFGGGSAWQCVPLVLCPAILRQPDIYLLGSQAACPLSDGSQGVQCPSSSDPSSPDYGHKYGTNNNKYGSYSSKYGHSSTNSRSYGSNYGSYGSSYGSSSNGYSRLVNERNILFHQLGSSWIVTIRDALVFAQSFCALSAYHFTLSLLPLVYVVVMLYCFLATLLFSF